jgi:hypothetical protein
VPQTVEARLEIAKAIRSLLAQDEEAQIARRRSELAALRRDLQLIAQYLRKAVRECAAVGIEELRKTGFNPDEPRVSAGNPDGGRWTREGGSGPANASRVVVSDATPDNTWIPGARYAANDPPNGGDRRKPPEIPQEKPTTPKAVNTFLKAAAYFIAGAFLAGEPVGDFILALEAADWASQYLPLVYSYLDAPKTLEELQEAAQNPQAGYNIHHIVEQTPAA